MTRNQAAAVGIFIAPLIASGIGVVLTVSKGGVDIFSALGLGPLFYFFSFLAEIIFGLPVFLLMLRLDLVRWWSVLSVGLFVGGLFAMLLRMPNQVQSNDLMTMVPIGGVSALCFWFIWKNGKPARRMDR